MKDSTSLEFETPKIPFRGIESFRFIDHPVFFAREEETENLLRQVTIYRGVLLYGDSGVGKSSLINAGFLPTMMDKKFAPHRLRVHPGRGEEIIVERISARNDGKPPYLPSIFSDNDSTDSRVVVSIEEFKKRLQPFRVDELEDRIALKLQKPSDSLTSYLLEQLSDETKQLISKPEVKGVPSEALRKSLARDLRRVIQDERLYDRKRFAHVKLSDDVRDLLKTNVLKTKSSDSGAIIYFNQRLIEEAYPRIVPPTDKYPLLIFDQFEEFVTLFEVAPQRGELKEALEVQAALLDMLVELLNDEMLAVKLLFSFREDYLAKLTKLFKRCPELTDQYLRLTPVQVRKLPEIISGPFKAFPGQFKPEFPTELILGLEKAIIDRSESGTVNLTEVQIACLKLWQSTDPPSLFQQREFQGLLEDYLSDALNQFPEEQRDPAIALLSRLVTSSSISSVGTRNVVSKQDLIGRVHLDESIPEDLLEEALRRLEVDAKLVRSERRYDVYFYEIVSEFLVQWISKQKDEREKVLAQRSLLVEVERERIKEKEQELSRRVTFDEQEFIAKVEASRAREFALLLSHPAIREETTLRTYFGDELYQRLHSMALKSLVSRGVSSGLKGNVVVIPGFGGSALNVSLASGKPDESIWINTYNLMVGKFEQLRLTEDGRNENNPGYKVWAGGLFKRHYGELLLSLSQGWNVEVFPFDWRKDLNIAADELKLKVSEWFGEVAPVHLVAHSMGGLVARTFIKRHTRRWEKMWDAGDAATKRGAGASGGRLVMLGTPNHGWFASPQIIAGLDSMLRKLALIDIGHKLTELCEIARTFVSLYQMLPSPSVMPAMRSLYNAATYGKYNVLQHHLDAALKSHQFLSHVFDPHRMIYVAGFDQPTCCDIKDLRKLNSTESYEFTMDGDGRVSHQLGVPRDARGQTLIPTYYVRDHHGNLSANAEMLSALDELLQTGTTDAIYDDLARARYQHRAPGGKPPKQIKQEEIRKRGAVTQQSEQAQLLISFRRMGSNLGGTSKSPAASSREGQKIVESALSEALLSPEARKVEVNLTSGFLASHGHELSMDGEYSAVNYAASSLTVKSASIEIGLVHASIHALDYERTRSSKRKPSGAGNDRGNYPVDAIAFGQYMGVPVSGAEKKLDIDISAELAGGQKNLDSMPDASNLILTQYTNRGIIHGRLAQPFFMPDPRVGRLRGRAQTDRLIAIAGMGEPGRLGVPELTVLVRELCWSLGRLNRRHLATVLIGTGTGNLSLSAAIPAWMEGIRRALVSSDPDGLRCLRRITFVEYDPSRIPEIDDLLRKEIARNEDELTIDYYGPSPKKMNAIKHEGFQKAKADLQKRWTTLEGWIGVGHQSRPLPTRVTLGLDLARKTYSFGVMTDTASVPEREVRLDPNVIMQANDALIAEQNPSMQLERGRFLAQLLIPDEMRTQLYNNTAPLVMVLDAAAARIHWELVAQPESAQPLRKAHTTSEMGIFNPGQFLGTTRGFTRQLRTMFTIPPPDLPARRVLRVLVVADPAPDAHLPGAQEEGALVADLFDSYNIIYKDYQNLTRVEVVRMFGPLEATRTNVLRELMSRQYDVLHFTGYSVYQWGGDPSLSGWVFNNINKEVLSPYDLNRIDNIPKFVFSNACESGITPDRSQDRAVDLAPSFAEAFFARGVANFVCTAWPVDDVAAREFALTLYSGLLGIKVDLQNPGSRPVRGEAKMMHRAIQDARIHIASTPNGRTTWGAYQHYGNPYFEIFYSTPAQQSAPMTEARARKKASNSKMSAPMKKRVAKKAKKEKKAGTRSKP